MSKSSIWLLAAAVLSFAAVMAAPAQAGNRDGECVEGGYGLGWKGGRPYYYTPFGVEGRFDCFTRPNVAQTTGKRANNRLYSDR